MKKILGLLLVLLLMMPVLVACNGDDTEEVDGSEIVGVTEDEDGTELEESEETEESPISESDTEGQITAVVEMLLNDWVDVLITYGDDDEIETVFLSAATDEFSALVELSRENVEIAETLLGSVVTLHSTLRDVYDIEVQIVMMDVSGDSSEVLFAIQADGTMLNAGLATE